MSMNEYMDVLGTPLSYVDPEEVSVTAMLTIKVYDRDGRLVRKHVQASRSPTWNGIIFLLLYSVGGTYTFTNTSGSKISISSPANCSSCSTGLEFGNGQTYIVGIAVGSGAQNPTLDVYNLAAPISCGSGAGQLMCGGLSYSSSYAVNGSMAYITVTQAFANNSGADITVSEVGLISNIAYWNASSQPGNVLVWYDLISPAITLSNGQTMTVIFTLAINT